jgi:hypothetical protein
MKLQSRSRDEPEINVISLVDVLLVLVLFFMVSTTFLRETELSACRRRPLDARLDAAGNGPDLDHGRALYRQRSRAVNNRRTARRDQRMTSDKRDKRASVFICATGRLYAPEL